MTNSRPLEAPQLPAQIKQVLDDFLQAARESFGKDLLSVVLYGSAAEGMLRATSDVNLALVLASFEQSKADLLRSPLRVSQAAIQLRPMFLLKEEISAAARSFASKFADILRRRVILHGDDPFASISIPREFQILELKQQLLNQILRLRASYVSRSLREEQLSLVIAYAIGPLRSSAAALVELQGRPAASSHHALELVGAELGLANWPQTFALLSATHESRLLPHGESSRLFFEILDLAYRMHSRAEALSGEVSRESL
ncbi:MAG TPA: nucleotidyltransferase domain-containing protein [Candidatus Acidoferrum sp.]|nr:nucleotidyltransferase domain-containing protein [Candidatus Acidoferrum sp.]